MFFLHPLIAVIAGATILGSVSDSKEAQLPLAFGGGFLGWGVNRAYRMRQEARRKANPALGGEFEWTPEMTEAAAALTAVGAQVGSQIYTQRAQERQMAQVAEEMRKSAPYQAQLLQAQALQQAAQARLEAAKRRPSPFSQPGVVLGIVGALGLAAIVLSDRKGDHEDEVEGDRNNPRRYHR